MKQLSVQKFFYFLPTAYGTPVLSVRWLCFQYYDYSVQDDVPRWLEIIDAPAMWFRSRRLSNQFKSRSERIEGER